MDNRKYLDVLLNYRQFLLHFQEAKYIAENTKDPEDLEYSLKKLDAKLERLLIRLDDKTKEVQTLINEITLK